MPAHGRSGGAEIVEQKKVSDELSLNPSWRARVREIGKMNFVREEMLRLGFFTEIDEKERQRLKTYLDDALPRLSKLKKELEHVLTEIADLDDVQSILKEVRSERIASPELHII